jgi:hypothetical protein
MTDLVRQLRRDAAEFDSETYAEAADCIETLKQVRDHAYRERNTLVAFLSHIYPAGLKATAIAGWDEEWHGCVYIDLPTGQASWHYHNNEAHLFAHLPPYEKEWDGHSNEDKYERLTLAANHAKQTDELLADYIKFADTLTAHTNNQNNRIKQLEAALRKIAEHHVPGVIPDGYTMFAWVAHNYGIMRNIARAALGEEASDDAAT